MNLHFNLTYVVKNINVKVFNPMSATNETRHIRMA